MVIPDAIQRTFEPLLAATQEEVLRSIGRNISGEEGGQSPVVLAILLAAASLGIGVAVLLNWRSRRKHPNGQLNDPSALSREITEELGLTKAQVRQLENLRHVMAEQGKPVSHLLTLLLCPSMLQPSRQQPTPPESKPGPRGQEDQPSA